MVQVRFVGNKQGDRIEQHTVTETEQLIKEALDKKKLVIDEETHTNFKTEQAIVSRATGGKLVPALHANSQVAIFQPVAGG